MTVAVATPWQQHTGDGTATTYTAIFPVLHRRFLKVYLLPSGGTDGVLQLQDGDYVVGGELTALTVTFGTAPASGDTVTLVRSTSLQQQIDYRATLAVLSETHERGFDYLTHILQELTHQASRMTEVHQAMSPDASLVSNYPVGKQIRKVFPAVLTDIDSSGLYPFEEVEWDEPRLRYHLLSGGLTGNSREFNNCQTLPAHRIVIMHEVVNSGGSASYRFPAASACGSYECCWGSGDGGGGATTTPTTPVAGAAVGGTDASSGVWYVQAKRCQDGGYADLYVRFDNILLFGRTFLYATECYHVSPFDTQYGTVPSGGVEVTSVTTADIAGCSNAVCLGPGACGCTSGDWDVMAVDGDDCGAYKQKLLISGFSPTMFTPNGDCRTSPAVPPDPEISPEEIEWDGLFLATETSPCSWGDHSLGTAGWIGARKHNGKSMGNSKVELVTGENLWRMTITCYEIPGTCDVWVGDRKSPGVLGNYYRTSGDDMRAIVTLVDGT